MFPISDRVPQITANYRLVPTLCPRSAHALPTGVYAFLMFNIRNVTVFISLALTLGLSACGQKETSASPTPSVSTKSQLEIDTDLISQLFYQDQIAASKSVKDLFDFQLANTYPGAVNAEIATSAFNEGNYPGSSYGVPDLTTLRLDPNWIVPVLCPADIDLVVPPKGTTYILAAEGFLGAISQVHVTVLDGKAFYYPSFCSF